MTKYITITGDAKEMRVEKNPNIFSDASLIMIPKLLAERIAETTQEPKQDHGGARLSPAVTDTVAKNMVESIIASLKPSRKPSDRRRLDAALESIEIRTTPEPGGTVLEYQSSGRGSDPAPPTFDIPDIPEGMFRWAVLVSSVVAIIAFTLND